MKSLTCGILKHKTMRNTKTKQTSKLTDIDDRLVVTGVGWGQGGPQVGEGGQKVQIACGKSWGQTVQHGGYG